MLEFLFNKVADLQACNVFKKRHQHGRFPVNIAKSLRTTILKIICERMLLFLEVFWKDFVNISYENASVDKLEHSIWQQSINFLTTIAFRLMKLVFRIDGGQSQRVNQRFFCVVYITQISHFGKLTRHWIN